MGIGAFWDEDVNRWYVEMDGNTVCHGLTEISAKNLRDVLDRLRAELVAAEGEADRLRSAYDDVRALNIKLTMTCTAELAAKNDRIAQLEAWRAACQEVRCYRVVEAETEALRKQLAEFGAGEDTTTMTRKSFAEVLQALADAQAGNEAKDARMAELEGRCGLLEQECDLWEQEEADYEESMDALRKELAAARKRNQDLLDADLNPSHTDRK